jgi:hypothetical protein
MFTTQSLEVNQLGKLRGTTESEILVYLCMKSQAPLNDSLNGTRKFHETSKTIDKQQKEHLQSSGWDVCRRNDDKPVGREDSGDVVKHSESPGFWTFRRLSVFRLQVILKDKLVRKWQPLQMFPKSCIVVPNIPRHKLSRTESKYLCGNFRHLFICEP